MNSGHCSGEHVEIVDDDEVRLSLNDLPDELLILIFNRLMDLKCLCFCSLVSPRFSSLIFLHVHSVHFSVADNLIPTPANPAADNIVKKTLRFFGKPLEYFRQLLTPKPEPLPSLILAFNFLYKFRALRSLHFVLPSSLHRQYCNPNPNCDDSLYKWAAKFGPTIDTFVFFTTSSVIRVGGEINLYELEQEELDELRKHRAHLAMDCFQDAIAWHRLLRDFVKNNPLLDNIAITDSESHGSLSLRDSEVVDTRNWLNSSSQTELDRIEVPVNIHHLHVPVLKLPVSSKVMVSATLVLLEMVDHGQEPREWCGDAAAFATLFSEQGEDELAEAVVEMMVNHDSRMEIIYTREG